MKAAMTNILNRFKSAPRPLRIFTYILLTYVTYALLLGVVTPAVIESQAPKKLSELLGRQVQITEVKINPFILRFQINGFAIAEQNGTDNFTGFEQMEFELNFWESLLNLAPNIDHFDLKQPQINITRKNVKGGATTFNFSDIPEHIARQQSKQPQQDTETTEEASSGIPAFIARSITIQQGSVSFNDNVTGAKLAYQDLNFTLSQLDTHALTLSVPAANTTDKKKTELKPEANQYSFVFTGADQSQLQLKGQFQLVSPEIKGDLRLSGLTLPPFWPFAADLMHARLISGEINFASAYHLKQVDEQFHVTTNQGEFSLTNLTFSAGQTPKVKLPKMALNGIALNTASQTVDLDSLTMTGFWADASIDEQGLDLQKLFTPATAGKEQKTKPTAKQSTASTSTNENPWLVRLNGFAMTETDLNLKESLVGPGVHWRVYPLSLSTGKIQSDLSQPIDYKLALGLSSDTQKQPIKQRGQFSSNGKLDAKKLSVDGKLQLTTLDLSQFQPYLEPHLNIDLNKGALSTEGDFSADSQGKVIYQGKAVLDTLLVKDGLKQEPLVKWKQMAMDSLKFDLAGKSLNINKILLDSPYAKVLIAQDRRTNIGEVMVAKEKPEEGTDTAENQSPAEENQEVATGESEQETTATQTESAFAVDIGKIEIVNGSAYFADYSLTPNFASGIELMEGYIDHLSSTPGTKAKLDIKGKIDKYAPVALSGEVNPLIEPPYLDLDFVLDSAELTSVNPYSGTYVGYYIDKGQLSLDINYKMEQNKLEGSNHVVVDQLTLGRKSDSKLATSLPVSLAIALLQDSDGVIDLGVDVSGDVDSPDFSIGGIILQALGNVITKAVTAPFSLLANLVGSDEELDIVEFKPGISALDSAGENRMNKLAKALKSRPKLKLSVEGAVNQMDDSHALAEAKLQNKLLTTSGLTELPSNLSASRIPESGPVASALENLFVQELKLDAIQERAKVEQKLMETEQVAAVDPAKVTSVLHIGMYNQLIKAQEVNDYDLGDLADARAKSIKAFLVNADIEPARVFVLNSRAEMKTEASQALLTLDAN